MKPTAVRTSGADTFNIGVHSIGDIENGEPETECLTAFELL